MALNRIDGPEDLYVGGIWVLRRPNALDERNITHVLSVVGFNPAHVTSESRGGVSWTEYGAKYQHLVIDVDDVDDEDLLIHLPKAVLFIDEGLYPPSSGGGAFEGGAVAPTADGGQDEKPARGAVYVHCAMGKSRSVAVVAAYLLWKHPDRFGRTAAHAAALANGASHPRVGSTADNDNEGDDNEPQQEEEDSDGGAPPLSSSLAAPASSAVPPARRAVRAAVAWIRRTRDIAEPNRGFMRQLELWWDMGCPLDVEDQPTYQRWAYRREVRDSARIGRPPDRLRFEDEEQARRAMGKAASAAAAVASARQTTPPRQGRELRCKKCRRVLATDDFILEHEPLTKGVVAGSRETGPLRSPPGKPSQHRKQQQNQLQRGGQANGDKAEPCPHFFIEPLSWMRATLEQGELDGRIGCPAERCGATVGRYSWKGFKCSCGAWVTPAFSLQRARVDEAIAPAAGSGDGGGAGRSAALAALGIRLPPGGMPTVRRENL